MGNCCCGSNDDDEKLNLTMVGLDNSGKSTILHQLKLGPNFNDKAPMLIVKTQPTNGFVCETVDYYNKKLKICDAGGKEHLRDSWKHHYPDSDGVIFVLDSSDADRVDEAKEELHKCLDEDSLQDVVLLVYSNKADIGPEIDVHDLIRQLGLDKRRERKWFVQPSIASTGEGLWEGINWLCTQIKFNKEKAKELKRKQV